MFINGDRLEFNDVCVRQSLKNNLTGSIVIVDQRITVLSNNTDSQIYIGNLSNNADDIPPNKLPLSNHIRIRFR